MYFRSAILLLVSAPVLFTLSAPVPDFFTKTYNTAAIGKRGTSIPIGYTGTDHLQAAEYEKKAVRTSNNVARLGTGLYLTDTYSLATAFAFEAQKIQKRKGKTVQQKVCVIYAKESDWIAKPKIWFPKSDLINPNPKFEEERLRFITDHDVPNPAVRFAHYDVEGYDGNELVIPPELQEGLSAKCWDPIVVTALGGSDEDADEKLPKGMPNLPFSDYPDVVKKWKIVNYKSEAAS